MRQYRWTGARAAVGRTMAMAGWHYVTEMEDYHQTADKNVARHDLDCSAIDHSSNSDAPDQGTAT